MKSSIKSVKYGCRGGLSAGFLAFALVVLIAPATTAQTELTDSQLDIIRQNCTQAQSTLRQIQRSDAVTRVNRGRAYESMKKLLGELNARAAINTYSVPMLTETTAAFGREFSAFKSTYMAYESQIAATLDIKCTDRPAEFYESLLRARDVRERLGVHVASMNGILDSYSRAVDELELLVGGVSR